MKVDPKTILGIALMGGIGFVAWKFYKGDWKLPSLPNLGNLLTNVPGVPKDINITLKESGVPGAAGDVVYNIVYPGNLREETTIPGTQYYEKARREIVNILPPDVTPQHEQIVPRSVAMKVATDIVEGRGFIPSMFLAPITIGAGLGAITQQKRYYDSLPKDARAQAVALEYKTREEWIGEHPIETAIGFPAVIIHAATKPTSLPEPTGTDFFSTMIRGVTRIREQLDPTPTAAPVVTTTTPRSRPTIIPTGTTITAKHTVPIPTAPAPTGFPQTLVTKTIAEVIKIGSGEMAL